MAALRKTADPDQKELLSTLGDLEAMAYLGRYYANKIRGAAELAVYRADPQRRAIMNARCALQPCGSDWEAYAKSATSQYKPQLFSRTHYMDWWKILEDVKKEAQSVQEEEKEPKELTITDPSTKGLSR